MKVKVVNINELEWSKPIGTSVPEGFHVKRLITKEREGSDKLMLGIFKVNPGKKGFAWSPHFIEVYYILRGKIRLHCNDESIEAKEGDAVFLPEGFKYQVDNLGAEEAEIVYVLAPPVE